MDHEAQQRQLNALWLHVTNYIKKQIVNPTLWIAMEVARPLTLEGNEIILGIQGHEFHLATNLEQLAYRTAIEKALSTSTQKPLKYRIIQGESVADWEELKERERLAQEMTQAASVLAPATTRDAQQQLKQAESWDEALTVAHKSFLALRFKTIPQARARYILDLMPMLYDTEARIYPDGSTPPDDRGLAHVLDKISQLTETDATLVGLEYLRYRQSRREREDRSSSQTPAQEG